MNFPALIFAGLLLVGLSLQAEIVLNEIVSQNTQNGFLAADGEAYDWIELHNTGAEEIDLQGSFLTDDPEFLTKWEFTRRFLIPAGDYAIVFASDRDELLNDQEHLNFKLDSGDGEYLGLIANDGVTVTAEFSPQFPALRALRSFGNPSEGGEATVLVTATPNAENSEGGPLPVIHSFTTSAEVIANGESVIITWKTENGTWVTLDTSNNHSPNVEASGSTILRPILNQTVTLRAWNEYAEAKQVITILVGSAVTSFSASPTTIATGGQSILRWTTEGSAQVIELEGFPVTSSPLPSVFIPTNLNLVTASDTWKIAPESPAANWRDLEFDDADWIDTPPSFVEKGKYRIGFEVVDPDSVSAGVLRVTNGSFFVATLNRTTIFDSGSPYGVARGFQGDLRIDPSHFKAGTNVLAIETFSDSLSYQFELGAWQSQPTDTIVPVTLKTSNAAGVSSKTVEILVLAEDTPLPPLPTIAITEVFWGYFGTFPVEPYRFFEVQNCGTETLDLAGIQLIGTSFFAFADSTDPLLEAGRHALVVNHHPTFSDIWPGDLPVVGQIEKPQRGGTFAFEFSSSLLDSYGRVFERISSSTLPEFGDIFQPWERIDPKKSSDDPENWFITRDYGEVQGGGTPGESSLRIVDFHFDPPHASLGDQVTLKWDVSRETALTISDGVGEVHGAIGSIELTVPEDARSFRFWLEAQGTYTRVKRLAQLVLPPAISYLGSNKTAILPGEEVQLDRKHIVPYSNHLEFYSSEIPPAKYRTTTFTPLLSGFPKGSYWRYLFVPDGLTPEWLEPDYFMLRAGSAPLGFGNDLVAGEIPINRGVTANFQKLFYVRDVDELDFLSVELMVDDGAVVYLNGQEIIRANLPAGDIDHLTQALTSLEGPTYKTFEIDPSLLVEGKNVIKAEVHNFTLADEDLIFDLAVHAQRPIPANGRKDYTLTARNEAGMAEATFTILFTEPLSVDFWLTENDLAGDPETIDSDADGINDLLEFATGSDPQQESPHPISFTLDEDGHYTVSYTRDLRTDDTTLTLQVSGDLIHWTNAASDQSGMVFKSAIAPAGTPVANVIFRSYAPIRGGQRYFRLIATP